VSSGDHFHDLMQAALVEADLAPTHGDVPIGALVVVGGEIVAHAHNEREKRGDPTAHAEVLALRAAGEALGSWRRIGATLLVTLEPCPMCAGGAVAARMERVVFGTPDPKAGACGSLYNLCADPRLNHELEVVQLGGPVGEVCADQLRSFFADRRPKGAES
jgi:tRNA(adenine34) deaminase